MRSQVRFLLAPQDQVTGRFPPDRRGTIALGLLLTRSGMAKSGGIKARQPDHRRPSRSWRLSLEAQNKSPRTISQYLDSLRLFETSSPSQACRGPPDRSPVSTSRPSSPTPHPCQAATAATRYKCLKLFFDWCAEEGEITRSPMANMRPPIVPEQPVPVLTDAELGRSSRSAKGRVRGSPRPSRRLPLRRHRHPPVRAGRADVDDVDLDASRHRARQGTPAAPRPLRSEDRTGHRPLPSGP